jgi:hypothetical protein
MQRGMKRGWKRAQRVRLGTQQQQQRGVQIAWTLTRQLL